MKTYESFLESKRLTVKPSGFDLTEEESAELADHLFAHQLDVVSWACRLGKAALWLDTGLGKTRCAILWASMVARRTGRPVLILTPLAVAPQFVDEGAEVAVDVEHVRDGGPIEGARVVVANYERLHLFNVGDFSGVVLDESSILKAFTGKTRTALVESFQVTPYRLACTATPAPNDFMELGNHAEFLGVMTRAEMLARYFVHDGGSTKDWRLKGHAEGEFWRWMASWAVSMRMPSDLGYSDDGFILHPLRMHEHVVSTSHDTAKERGLLFHMPAETLLEQRRARKATIGQRVELAADLVAEHPDDQWILWCELNDESRALVSAIPGAVEVTGSMPSDEKEARLVGFSRGDVRVMVTKPSIAGFGMNWQKCHRVAFVGVGHSFEAFYQAVRRTWRFGQQHPVDCHVISSDIEGAVLENLRRKQSDAEHMASSMIEAMGEINRAALRGTARTFTAYDPRETMAIPPWLRPVAA